MLPRQAPKKGKTAVNVPFSLNCRAGSATERYKKMQILLPTQ
jgi:hypothetical protein